MPLDHLHPSQRATVADVARRLGVTEEEAAARLVEAALFLMGLDALGWARVEETARQLYGDTLDFEHLGESFYETAEEALDVWSVILREERDAWHRSGRGPVH